MFLLVRNVDKPGFGNPVELVRKAITEICDLEEGSDLSEITLDVLPSGRSQDIKSASAYVELSQEIKALDLLPRSDLLLDWMIAITKHRPTWNVVWAPQK
jgi:hypothetical protein